MAERELKVPVLSVHRELGLSRNAQVFRGGADRLVLDPEAERGKVRVRLFRRPNVSGGFIERFDEERDLDVEAVMAGVPPGFARVVADVVRLFRSTAFKTRR